MATKLSSILLLILTTGVVNGVLEDIIDLPTLVNSILQLINTVEQKAASIVMPVLGINPIPDKNEEGSIFPTTLTLIKAAGYPVESHYVQTTDKVILNMFRIPHGIDQQYDSSRIPIVLQHGVFLCSDMWVADFENNNSLGFLLAEMGYDVWLGNFRGNEYSTNTSNPGLLGLNNLDFWNFCYDENAAYDITGMLDHIATVTGHQQVIWIGYSMGTTSIMALLSSLPQYNNRLYGFIGLAPATRLRYGVGSILQSTKNYQLITTLLNTVGATGISTPFLTTNDNIKSLWQAICPDENPYICMLLLDLLFGILNESTFKTSFIPNLLWQFPAGGSLRQFLHYVQTAKFSKYNFFPLINQLKYKQLTAPVYNLSNIVVPTYLIFGDNDCLTTPLDQAWYMPQIPGLKAWTRVDWLTYTHVDFAMSYRNNELLFPLVFNYLDDIKQNMQT